MSDMVTLYHSISDSWRRPRTCAAVEFKSTTIRDETGTGTRGIQELNKQVDMSFRKDKKMPAYFLHHTRMRD